MKKILGILTCFVFVGCTNKTQSIHHNEWILNGSNQSLAFDKNEKNFYGFDGCNNIFGKLKLNKEGINFQNFNSTLKLCEDMSKPNEFVHLLKKVSFYKINNANKSKLTTLHLYDKSRQEILVFTQAK